MTNQILAGAPEESAVVQQFGPLPPSRIGLSEAASHRALAALNRWLAHTMAIRDCYDLIVAEVVRRNELQSWFVGEHLASHTG